METLIMIILVLATVVSFILLIIKKAKVLVITIPILLVTTLLLFGFRFSAIDAIPGKVKEIHSYDTVYGKAILYEDSFNHTFGLAQLKQSYGFLYHYDGGTNGYFIEEGKPFEVAGVGNDQKNGFLVGVKTAENSDIEAIVVGGHFEGITPFDSYDFSMNTVEENPDQYHVQKVINHFAFFVLDEYSEETWTIRGLDRDGKLVADKLFGADIRYIDW
ncbi:hypothetical protein SAMN05192533_101485 [Mesobacillus persicus]|uniref:Uncharacterized protein n=1 Tax=Mesobacillus persicus TaxID=930146 RepID=A0A1H7WMS0_9BACI|nr:hypothetical protein [Mesobacillus persicus]SEM22288.1 hypothetical protein SAMN05192533_101485 [Mesobacillus persicus]